MAGTTMERTDAEGRVAGQVDAGGELGAQVIAVLTAAAAIALDAPVVLHQARVYSAEAERWSRAGRMDIMVSHSIGPRR
jgi:hypothetical protein